MPRPRLSPCTAPVLIAAAALVVGGCGAEGTEAPAEALPQTLCPTVDEQLAGTLAALTEGRAERLAASLDLMEILRPDAAQGLLAGVLAIAGELWRSGLREDLSILEALTDLLDGATPLLTDLLRYLADDGAVQRDALEAASVMIATCPDRALTDALALLVSRPELVRALGDLVEDPLVVSIIEGLDDPQSGQSGEAGFVALFRTIIRALASPNFVFGDLTALIDPFFDLDAPPFDALVRELELLLTAENLVTVRTLVTCLDTQVVVRSGRSGTEAVGALLFHLITAPSLRLGQRLGELGPVLDVVDDPRVRAALQAIVARLQQDEAVRHGLRPAVLFLLAPEHAPGVLGDAAALLEAGLLPELLGLLTDILEPCTTAREPAP